MNDVGFTPNVHRHEGNPADEHTRKLYALFTKVAEAEKALRKAILATGEAENQARVARERQDRAKGLFDAARRELLNALDGQAPQ